jgi:hypothetical protein
MENFNEETYDNIITNLKIISKIKVDEKLCIRKGHLQIDNSSNFQFLKRWYYRDSRDFILLFIKDLIRSISTVFEKSKGLANWVNQHILNEMENAKTGLVNLKTTYSTDSIMIVKFEHVANKFCELIEYGKKLK